MNASSRLLTFWSKSLSFSSKSAWNSGSLTGLPPALLLHNLLKNPEVLRSNALHAWFIFVSNVTKFIRFRVSLLAAWLKSLFASIVFVVLIVNYIIHS